MHRNAIPVRVPARDIIANAAPASARASHRPAIKLLVVLASMSIGLVSALSCAYAAAFRWDETTLPMSECASRATAALTEAGFTDLQNKFPFMAAGHGEYIAIIFCGTHKGLLTYTVIGPDETVNGAYIAAIAARFQARTR